MTLRRDMKNALSELRQDYAHSELQYEIADCDREIAECSDSSVELNGGTKADDLKRLEGRREALVEEAIAMAERRIATAPKRTSVPAQPNEHEGPATTPSERSSQQVLPTR